MKDEGFREEFYEKGYGAVIIAGSGSDDEPKINPATGEEGDSHIGEIVKSLQLYEIPCEVRIGSGHKQPYDVMGMVSEYNQAEGALAMVTVAGGTDALSGIVAYHSMFPAISCPPPSEDGSQHNESCLNNPPGSSNAYVKEPANVGRLVAQMFSHLNPELRNVLLEKNKSKINSLHGADKKINRNYAR